MKRKSIPYTANLVVITSFPERGHIHGKKVVGIASYAKNTLIALKKHAKDLQIHVLAETFNDKKSTYTDQGIRVTRIWKRNSLMTFPKLFWKIATQFRKTDKVLIELELAMFGSIIHLLPLPLFALALRIMKKDVSLVLHQVILDTNEMHGHLNIDKHSMTAHLLNMGMYSFYWMLLKSVGKVIVFENTLAEQLFRFKNPEDIITIPHAVESFNARITKVDARKDLKISRDTIVLFTFGFVSWYKGTDWLVDQFKQLRKKYKKHKLLLIIGGGPNPNHLSKQFYARYVERIQSENNTHIRVTGFLPEHEIPRYFKAADLVVLPYRALMSSSGPLSIAYAFQKPILLSKPLEKILGTPDLQTSMKSSKVKKDDIVFANPRDFEKKVMRLVRNKRLQKNVTTLTKGIAKSRSWSAIGRLYYENIFAQN